MESRKQFKLSSIVVLVFAGVHLLHIVADLWFGDLHHVAIPEGAPENILLITKIFLLSFSLLLLLPQIYIGVKGLRIAKNPTRTKGHIVLAIILLAFAVLSLIGPVAHLISHGALLDDIMSLLSYLLEVIVFAEYIKYAIAVSKEC